eukprot:GHVP01051031.1.p1 GENE.GHVP01051031.1~~GHVP01051031.1.p1  ORF type:complete len:226 (+),score=13.32 GHVP01051031.1:117-794(+)
MLPSLLLHLLFVTGQDDTGQTSINNDTSNQPTHILDPSQPTNRYQSNQQTNNLDNEIETIVNGNIRCGFPPFAGIYEKCPFQVCVNSFTYTSYIETTVTDIILNLHEETYTTRYPIITSIISNTQTIQLPQEKSVFYIKKETKTEYLRTDGNAKLFVDYYTYLSVTTTSITKALSTSTNSSNTRTVITTTTSEFYVTTTTVVEYQSILDTGTTETKTITYRLTID